MGHSVRQVEYRNVITSTSPRASCGDTGCPFWSCSVKCGGAVCGGTKRAGVGGGFVASATNSPPRPPSMRHVKAMSAKRVGCKAEPALLSDDSLGTAGPVVPVPSAGMVLPRRDYDRAEPVGRLSRGDRLGSEAPDPHRHRR